METIKDAFMVKLKSSKTLREKGKHWLFEQEKKA